MNGSRHRVLGAEEFRAQDPEGLALFETCMEKVVPYLRSEFGAQLSDAEYESLAAAAFVTAYRKGFDPDGQPVAYVKKIARNEALDYLEKSSRAVPVDPTDPTGLLGLFAAETPADDADPADADLGGSGPDGGREKEDRDLWGLVDPAISGISAPQTREVIRRQSLGQHDEEIAADLRIPANQVYQQRSRGTTKLQTALAQYIRPGGEPPTPTEPGGQ